MAVRRMAHYWVAWMADRLVVGKVACLVEMTVACSGVQ
jgi:hypothetical protein